MLRAERKVQLELLRRLECEGAGIMRCSDALRQEGERLSMQLHQLYVASERARAQALIARDQFSDLAARYTTGD